MQGTSVPQGSGAIGLISNLPYDQEGSLRSLPAVAGLISVFHELDGIVVVLVEVDDLCLHLGQILLLHHHALGIPIPAIAGAGVLEHVVELEPRLLEQGRQLNLDFPALHGRQDGLDLLGRARLASLGLQRVVTLAVQVLLVALHEAGQIGQIVGSGRGDQGSQDLALGMGLLCHVVGSPLYVVGLPLRAFCRCSAVLGRCRLRAKHQL